MSPDGVRSIRGYRPSRYGSEDGWEDEERLETLRIVKIAKIRMYLNRAEAGLPIFEDDETPEPPPRRRPRKASG